MINVKPKQSQQDQKEFLQSS